MKFAPINSDLSYWQKQSKPLFPDLAWNIPEQKTGHIAIVGGNSQSFATVIRIAEFTSQNFPFASVSALLPDALRGKLPPLTNIDLFPSTNSGSFAKSYQLQAAIQSVGATLVIGDLSRNAATAVALADAIMPRSDSPSSSQPTLGSQTALKSQAPPDSFAPLVLARDSVDLLASEASRLLLRPNIFFIASMAQLQKLFRAIYYPRMILLSQPLLPILETLHKFTLSYPATILTFHQENLIVAHAGKITTTHLADTDYSPISLWSGQLAARVMAFNYFTPNHPLEATTAAILHH